MSIVIETDRILKDNVLIMHRDVTQYENAAADIVAQSGGNILEIGFGLGISADRIQTHNPTKHVIIEIEPEIYTKAVEWAEGKSNVQVIQGDWIDQISSLTDSFDGVYNDADNDEDADCLLFSENIKSKCNAGCKLVQTNWGSNNTISSNSNTVETFEPNEDLQNWFGNGTVGIVYATLNNNNWV